MLRKDALQLIVGLAAGKLRRPWGRNIQLARLLRQPTLGNAEAVLSHAQLGRNFRGNVLAHRLQGANALGAAAMFFGEHHIECLHDGGLACLVLAVDDHDAGLRQLIEGQVLNTADIGEF